MIRFLFFLILPCIFNIDLIAKGNHIQNDSSIDLKRYDLNQFLNEIVNDRISTRDGLQNKVRSLRFEEVLTLKKIQDKVKKLDQDLRKGDNSSINEIDRLLTEDNVEIGLKFYYIYKIYNKCSVKATRNEYVKDSLKFLHLSALNGFEKGVNDWVLRVLYDRLAVREDYVECRGILEKCLGNEEFVIFKKWLDILLRGETERSMEIEWVLKNSDKLLEKYPKILKDTGIILILSKDNPIDQKRGLCLLKKYAYKENDIGTLLNIIYLSGNVIECSDELLKEIYQKINSTWADKNFSGSEYLAHQGWNQDQNLREIHNTDDFVKYCLKKINEIANKKGIKYIFK